MAWTFYPVHTAPVALDIVWCRFPMVEDPQSPGPKDRPGLVRKVIVKGDCAYVEVCYGTSKTHSYSDLDLLVNNLADMVEMRLPQATIFQLARTATLPWAKEWFAPLDGVGPKLSHLTPKYCEYMALLTRRRR